ncbi:MAG: NAD-dependent epimerase/dehydratase family protein, partial [Calditrichia bacterium]
MKKILITGANGLLGQTMVRRLHERFDVLATGVEPKFVLDSDKYHYEILDITDATQCKSFITNFTP